MNKAKLNSRSKAYDFLYNLFNLDGIDSVTIDQKEFEKALKLLNLNIGNIIILASKKGHFRFLEYAVVQSLNIKSKDLRIGKNNYEEAIINAIKDSNIDILKFLLEIMPIEDNNKYQVISLRHISLGISYEEGLKIKNVGDFFLALFDKSYIGQNIKGKYKLEDIDININEKYIDYAFYIASRTSNLKIMKYLASLRQDSKARIKMLRFKNDEIFLEAIKEGNLDVIKYLLGIALELNVVYKIMYTHSSDYLLYALEYGHIEVLKYLQKVSDELNVQNQIIRQNSYTDFNKNSTNISIDVLEYIIEHKDNSRVSDKRDILYNAFSSCAKEGNIDSMKYIIDIVESLHEEEISKEERDKSKDMGLLEVLLMGVIGYIIISLFVQALEIIRYRADPISLNDMIESYSFEVFRIAAENGQLDVLKYLLNLEKLAYSKKTIIHAKEDYAFSYSPNIEVLRYLVELTQDPELRYEMIHADCNSPFINAASNGNIECLRYIVKLDQDFQENYFNSSIDSNKPRRYINNVFTKFEKLFWIVAKNGHETVLKYLVQLLEMNASSFVKINDASISNLMNANNYDSIEEIVKSGHIEVFKYILSLSSSHKVIKKIAKDIYNSKLPIFTHAVSNGHVDFMKYLIQDLLADDKLNNKMIHAKDNLIFRETSSNGQLEVLEYLVEITPNKKARTKMIHSSNDEAFRYAAKNDQIEVLKYLVDLISDNKLIFNMIHAKNDDAFKNAASSGHVEVMQYLYDLSEELIRLNDESENKFLDSAPAPDSFAESIKSVFKKSNKDLEINNINSINYNMIHSNNDMLFRDALIKKDIKTMKCLLDLTQDLNSRLNMINNNNDSECYRAIKNCKVDEIEILLESFLKQESCNKISYPILKQAIDNNIIPEYLAGIEPDTEWSCFDFSTY